METIVEQIIRWGVPVFCGGLIGVLAFGFRWIRALKHGMVSLLADRLGDICCHHLDRGYCTPFARRNATRLYDAYHGLGKNGEMTDRYRKLLSLPVKDDNL